MARAGQPERVLRETARDAVCNLVVARRAGTVMVLALVSSLTWVGAAVAQGCGPTRLKVAESVVLDMTPQKAWALVGGFQDMSWDVETTSTSGTGGDVPDVARRTLHLRGGVTLGESLYAYDAAAMSYSYHIDTIDVAYLPAQNVSATIEVVPRDGGTRSQVRWRAAFYRFLAPNEPPPDVADAKAAAAMSAYLKAGLAGLRAKDGDTKGAAKT